MTTAQVLHTPGLNDEELNRLIAASDVVSFDFFDTLFTRPLAHPEDAFDILGRQFDVPDFRERRRAAQAEAFRRMAAAGRKEIRFADIYECLSESGLPSEALRSAEYLLELALVEPNAEMLDLCRRLCLANKLVVITSDMYLDGDFFRDVLRRHQLPNLPLFVSADFNATKRDNGELFDLLAEQLAVPKSRILHVGDNLIADVERPRARGLQAFHYKPSRTHSVAPSPKGLDASIGHGLLRTKAVDIEPNSHAALGYLCGGPANLGFLQWIAERAAEDGVENLLFLSRDGFTLERIARNGSAGKLPPFGYFLGSRTAYTLAAMNADNFVEFLPYLLSGSHGLSPGELLERVGVSPPAPRVMTDLGLGDDVQIASTLNDELARFLFARRWEILKICQRNRGALYRYLQQSGLRPGARVALVDVGWSGTTQEAFELATRHLLPLEVHGYYFCLADTPERLQRADKQRMSSLIGSANVSAETVAALYANRVAVEPLFSAPHPSVIGFTDGRDGVEPIYDLGRGDCSNNAFIASEICRGSEAFARDHAALRKRFQYPATPLQTAWPLIDWITSGQSTEHPLLGQLRNFDAWASTRNS